MAADMVQVHMLTPYPASLLNRDATGNAKRIPYGGAIRTRVSSQCLKKHWRDAEEIRGFGQFADRSRMIYEERVAKRLREDEGATEEEAVAIAEFLLNTTVDSSIDKDKEGRVRSKQLLVLTRAESDYLGELAARILKRVREGEIDLTKKDALKKAQLLNKESEAPTVKVLKASIDTAMFGRMVTSDLFARVDSAVSVAHAFTTHAEQDEPDYFTAVDTLKTESDDAGAGTIQETELSTGVFYVYAVIDMNQLRDNLGGAADAEALAAELVRVMATRSPGAKRGSTAPFAYAEFVLLERGRSQPRSLAAAFIDPVKGNGTDLVEKSVRALLERRGRLEGMHGANGDQVALATIHTDALEGRLNAVPLEEAAGSIFRPEA